MEIEMKIKGLIVDPISNMPIVVLKDINSNKILPIWIGVFEANAIALQIEKIPTPRPMTHDLIKNIFNTFGIVIQKVVVNQIKDNTFYALIYCKYKDEIFTLDSRPSDAIAIALRVNAPIYVTEEVMEKAHSLDIDENLEDSEKLQKWLEKLKPEDLGKYKM